MLFDMLKWADSVTEPAPVAILELSFVKRLQMLLLKTRLLKVVIPTQFNIDERFTELHEIPRTMCISFILLTLSLEFLSKSLDISFKGVGEWSLHVLV